MTAPSTVGRFTSSAGHPPGCRQVQHRRIHRRRYTVVALLARSNELQIDRQTLETQFLNLAGAEGVTDIDELNKILERATTLTTMLKNKERVERVAKNIAEHFRNTIEPMGYKAFIVAVDREACALYKEELDRQGIIPPSIPRSY